MKEILEFADRLRKAQPQLKQSHLEYWSNVNQIVLRLSAVEPGSEIQEGSLNHQDLISLERITRNYLGVPSDIPFAQLGDLLFLPDAAAKIAIKKLRENVDNNGLGRLGSQPAAGQPTPAPQPPKLPKEIKKSSFSDDKLMVVAKNLENFGNSQLKSGCISILLLPMVLALLVFIGTLVTGGWD